MPLNILYGQVQVCHSLSPTQAHVGTQYLAWSHVKTFKSSFSTVAFETCFTPGNLVNDLCFLLISLSHKRLRLMCVLISVPLSSYQTFPQQCQLSEITIMNAIGADSAASLSLLSKTANSLPKFGSQC